MRLVLDTDVVVAAFRSAQGASAALLYAADMGYVNLFATVALMLEYEAVCSRPAQVAAANVRQQGLQEYLGGLAVLMQPVCNYFVWQPQLLDVGDELVLEAAMNGRAEAIVTFNVKDFAGVPEKFGIEIVNPKEILWRLNP